MRRTHRTTGGYGEPLKWFRLRFIVIAVVVLAASCTAQSDPSEPDTTLATGNTASAATSSTTAGAPASTSTTSTAAPTTTTAVTTTTTTTPATSTTSAPDVDAVVVSEWWVLGMWSNGAWHSSDAVTSPPVGGYTRYSVDEPIITLNAGAVAYVCEWFGVTPRIDFGGSFAGVAVNVSAESSIGTAKPVTVTGPTLDVLSAILVERGISPSTPLIPQAFETDVDRDGTVELLVTVDRNALMLPSLGDHSFVVMLTGSSDDPNVQIVEFDMVSELASEDPQDMNNWFYTATKFRVSAIADLNGDDIDEMVVRWEHHESSGEIVYSWDPDTNLWSSVASEACGV